jgi:hypothetical protein
MKLRLLWERTSLNLKLNARPPFHEINQLIIDRRRPFAVLCFPSSFGSRQPSVPSSSSGSPAHPTHALLLDSSSPSLRPPVLRRPTAATSPTRLPPPPLYASSSCSSNLLKFWAASLSRCATPPTRCHPASSGRQAVTAQKTYLLLRRNRRVRK